MNDKIAFALAEHLPPRRMDTVMCLESVDSTNARLRALALSGAPSGQVVIAETQSRGRGRMGREFASPKGKGIYLSFLVRPEFGAEELLCLTPCTAVAVCRVVEKLCGAACRIKWVNDLLLDGKKLCGILTEAFPDPGGGLCALIGIGLNVNTTAGDFPPQLRETAASLFTQTGREHDRSALAAGIISALDEMCSNFAEAKAEYLDYYTRRCITPGSNVKVLCPDGSSRTAFAAGIADDFSLILKNADGSTEKLSSGDVSFS